MNTNKKLKRESNEIKSNNNILMKTIYSAQHYNSLCVFLGNAFTNVLLFCKVQVHVEDRIFILALEFEMHVHVFKQNILSN